MTNEDSLRTNYLCNRIFKQIMALQEMALFLDLPIKVKHELLHEHKKINHLKTISINDIKIPNTLDDNS